MGKIGSTRTHTHVKTTPALKVRVFGGVGMGTRDITPSLTSIFFTPRPTSPLPLPPGPPPTTPLCHVDEGGDGYLVCVFFLTNIILH